MNTTASHSISAATDESISLTVIRAVADAKGVDPVDMDARLNDYVEPDALDRLFASGSGQPHWDGRVSFTMADCRVEISGSGTVVVTPVREDATAPEAVAD